MTDLTLLERDHVQDIGRLRRRILALEDQLGLAEHYRGCLVPQSLLAELGRTAAWAMKIFVAYGLDTEDDFE